MFLMLRLFAKLLNVHGEVGKTPIIRPPLAGLKSSKCCLFSVGLFKESSGKFGDRNSRIFLHVCGN